MAHPYQIAIRQLGCRATGVRQWGRTGQLFALFQNSFYFNLDEALFLRRTLWLELGPTQHRHRRAENRRLATMRPSSRR